MRLNQVTAGCTDLERSERFYTLLGLRLIVSDERYRRFECLDGSSTFSLEQVERVGEEELAVYFETPTLDADYHRLRGAGIVFDRAPADMPWLWREARLRDPDGHHVCLYHAGVNRRFPPWRLATAAVEPSGDALQAITLEPVGVVAGGRVTPEDDEWEAVEATIVLDGRFGADALSGLDAFSHIDVVYVFHRVDEASIVTGARHPRGNSAWPSVGIFAQRAKARPNRLAISTCRLLGVERRTLRVAGLDAIDGSPVLDIKPHVTEMGPRGDIVEPPWIRELMEHYWK